MPHHHADAVHGATGEQHSEGNPKRIGDSKPYGRQAESSHSSEQGASSLLKRRPVGQDERAEQGTGGQRGLQDAQAAWPDAQDVFGINRQQRGCPAEENREQVESDRSQNDLAGKNEFEAGDQARLSRLERAGLLRRGRPISRRLLSEAPATLEKGASSVKALLEEREERR